MNFIKGSRAIIEIVAVKNIKWSKLFAIALLTVIIGDFRPTLVIAQKEQPLQVKAAIIKDFPPIYQVNDKGEPTGFAIDVMNTIAQQANLKVTYLTFDDWDQVENAVLTGKADLIPSFGITEERAAKLSFTTPLETIAISLFVRRNTSDINSFGDLKKHPLAVVKGSVALELLRETPTIKPVIFDQPDHALFQLLAGEVDAMIYPEPVLWQLARKARVDDHIKVVDQPLIELKRAIAFNPQNLQLKVILDPIVANFITTDEYKQIYIKWYGKATPYWTTRRIIWFMGGLIVVTIIVMGTWRFLSLRPFYRLKETEKALAISEARYRSIVEDQTELICRFLPNGTLTFVNQAYCHYFAKTEAELVGHQFLPLIPEEDQELISINFAKINQDQPTITYEHRVINPQEQIRWQQWTDHAFYDESGNITELQAVGRDITLLKEAEITIRQFNQDLENRVKQRTAELEIEIKRREQLEAFLRETNARYKRLVENSPAIIYSYSTQRGALYCSARLENILGYNPDQMQENPWLWSNSIHPEDQQRVASAIAQFVENDSFELEYRIRDAQGNWHWFYDRSIGKQILDQEIIIEGLALDITARKQAELQLQQAHQRLKFHIENTPLAVVEWDHQFKVRFWSAQAEKIFGWTETDVIGKDFTEWQFIYPEDITHVQTIAQELISGTVTGNICHNRNYHKNGLVVECQWYNSALFDNQGNLESLLSLALDVTLAKQQEREINQQKELLQTIIDNIPVMLARMTADHRFQWINRTFEQVLGWNLVEINNNPNIWQEFYPDFQYRQYVFDYITTAASKWGDFQITLRDGRVLDTTWADIRLSDGTTIGIGQDITERKQMERALRGSEAKYKMLFESNPQCLWVYDLETLAFLEVNQAAINHYGYSREQFLAMTLRDICHPEDITRFEQYISNLSQEVSNLGIWRHRKQNGEIITVEIISHVIEYHNRPARLSLVNDITEQIHTQQALQNSEERFRRAIMDAPLPIIIHAEDGEILQINRVWIDITGYTPAEIPTIQAWTEKAYQDKSQLAQLGIEGLFDLQHPINEGEFTIITKNGTELIWNFSSAPLGKLADGRRAVISMALDITQRKQAEAKLLHDNLHDSLTGLPNRVLFMERIDNALQRSQRYQDYIFAVLVIDLDRFKILNDSIGHQMGDLLIIEIAHTLSQCVRSMDTLARLGGDEFVMLLDELHDMKEAIKIADRIHAELSTPFKINDQYLYTTASIGIVFNGHHYQNGSDILRDADNAMYRAKERGRSRYEIFDPTMYAEVRSFLELETDLRKAIDNQEFEVYYQPIVNLKTLKLAGFEALIRWQHPEKGLISPMKFIPIAEETGLILAITQFMLNQACQQMQTWHHQYTEQSYLKISVNLSAKDLQQPHLIEQITNIIHNTGLSSHSLKLEITESTLMLNSSQIIKFIQQVREHNIQISLDDFGTGYSSLSYLHRFPIDTLKIDKSFVKRIGRQGNKKELVSAIISMAHTLSLDVIAEGIETEEQLVYLQNLGCEFGQGYLFAAPLDTESATKFVMGEMRNP